MSDKIVEFVVYMIVAVVLLGMAWGLASYRCSSKWSQSGMATSWGPIQGCLIQRDGRWIPSENYREL